MMSLPDSDYMYEGDPRHNLINAKGPLRVGRRPPPGEEDPDGQSMRDAESKTSFNGDVANGASGGVDTTADSAVGAPVDSEDRIPSAKTESERRRRAVIIGIVLGLVVIAAVIALFVMIGGQRTL